MPPVLSPLPALSLSKNPIWLKIQSDDYRSATPVIAVNFLDFLGAIAADDVLTLSWNKGTASITAKVTPDGSGRQIPTGAGDNAYVTGVAAYFQGNYFIDRDFIVTVNLAGPQPRLIFTARIAGADYNFTVVTAGNFSSGNITPGVTGVVKSNFSHYVEIWVQDLTHTFYTLAYAAVVPLDGSNTALSTIDISNAIHSYLTLDTPQLSGAFWQACNGSSRNYYVKYAQYFGDDPSIQRIYTSVNSRVIFGGYSELALSQILDLPTHLSTYLLPNPSLYKFQRWLETWPVDNFTVKTNTPAFLYFINNRSFAETFKLRVDLVFSDGSANTIYLAGGAVNPLAKVAVGCGYQQLGLQAYTTVINVSSYQVSIVESASLEARSIVKSFTVNRDYEEYSRDFLYADSCGNFKTLHTFGKSQVTADTEFDQVEYQPDTSVLPQKGNFANANIRAVISDKINTGYISGRGTFDAVSELLLSKQVFRVFGITLVPIVITSKKFDYSADGRNLNAFALEYRLAYNEDVYTADTSAMPLPNFSHSQQAFNDL